MKKYAQVLADLEHQIREGRYGSGHKLPSVRSAANTYGCSISTIIRAYAELEKLHLIYAMPQSGFYVVEKQGDSRVGAETSRIDLASASPDVSVFPYLDFQHCLNTAIDTFKYNLFTYGDPQGLDKLRQTLVSHLADSQVFTQPKRIVVTSGAQQALEIVARMPFPNGKSTILVEQPGYDIYLRFLEMSGLPTRGMKRTAAGIDLQELEKTFKDGDIKFFYTMPRYHNPLGTTYSAETRKAIADLASKYDVYVVEDDYMADLGEEKSYDPVYAYNRTSHVVYVKSFSKIIFPGLGLGAAVLPERLLAGFLAQKSYADTSLLSQASLEVYIRNGMYERHKITISRQYTARIGLLNEVLQQQGAEGLIEAADVRSGIYMQFKLPRQVNLDQLMKRLAARRIHVVPGGGFYMSGWREREKFVRVSISRARPEQIGEAVQVIVEEVRRGMRYL
ncbi:PLP-dependent aminotransferase family protein [Paenibacillus whitsoniae]|uniref:PLP-dependent aminotransferase family protein n=1 Tax=Paenibacillus whitsoniae TaxID=2496558 RepID=A0A430JIR2_9BACL|nr:PLP-dependent aminotransferase family protein [Paenibacillus whitsoniae]RTE10902.1 PLP-dependent aminotransferase family protein [Paenibacillus whitsoniae]